MGDPDSTRWTVIRGAASGEAAAREEFALRYQPVIRAYLGARWRRTPLYDQIDDAVQEVFVDCFKDEGALARVDSRLPGGFRAFLYGVVRNVARRFEERRYRQREVQPGSRLDLEELPAEDEALSRVFDRAWALAVVMQAADLHALRATERGGVSVRRLELLRLRFGEGMPIRDIARAWNEDPVTLHADYARGRSEFKTALREVLRTLHPDREVETECDRLLELLG
jgi:RNA polymerase sigma-70 factor (ECF subfamily)